MSTKAELEGALARLERRAFHDASLGLSLDLSHMGMGDDQLAQLGGAMTKAFAAMARLEGGAIANPDEKRMVGHYWLRAPELAPDAEIRGTIEQTSREVRELAGRIRSGALGAPAGAFRDAIMVGIGGSSLGPQLVYEALGRGPDGLRLHFANNTDPDGLDRLVAGLDDLGATLTVVISKSGGTKETRNAMLEIEHAYHERGLALGPHAIAITQEGSKLDGFAREASFLARLPMWDWVGGRTSVTSAVGLLPAALQGVDVDALLAGAAEMDRLTREPDPGRNPAALLAAGWYLAGDGRGRRAMVMLPYKDRLELTSRYLQQLVMESLGKAEDLTGATVHQGLTVYGNKGSTDQHAYVQQLLDGPDDFFVTFIQVLHDRDGGLIEVEPGITTGDFLSGFLQGTRKALAERGRRSLTLTLNTVDARSMGALIALYERAVGLYAELIGINAYHQPAVESGKRAAGGVLRLQARILTELSDTPRTPVELAEALDTDDLETVVTVVRHLAANRRIRNDRDEGQPPWRWRYRRI